MKKNEPLALFIIDHVGGAENVAGVSNCLTRLRFDLLDQSKVDEDALRSHEGIVTTRYSGGRFQIVIGAHVGEVADAIASLIHPGAKGGGDADEADARDRPASPIDRLTATITQVMTPILGVLGGCGMIAGLSSILLALGLISSGDGTHLALNALGNACLTFLPVLLGYTSAKAFGVDPFIGMVLGAFLMFPDLAEGMTAGEGGPLYTVLDGTPLAVPVFRTFLGIPVLFPATGYTSTVIPIVFSVYLASFVQRRAISILPAAAHMFVVPAVVVLVAGILTLLLVGPVAVMLTNLIAWAVNGLLETAPIVAYLVIALVYQPLVIFGLHWALIGVGLLELSTTGSTIIIGLIFPASFAHLAVCAAVGLRSREGSLRATCLAAVISACFCIIEPSIYGVTLPVRKRFGICMVSAAAGALVIGLSQAPMFAIAMGVTGFASFIDPAGTGIGGMLSCLLAVAATMLIGFALAWTTFRPGEGAVPSPDAEASK